ncbi:MAG: hypothetical protein HRU05_20190 [Oceanospirillaceae bacterium]|nr:hypothetical protein [Oceanospirillaceae bacterium]
MKDEHIIYLALAGLARYNVTVDTDCESGTVVFAENADDTYSPTLAPTLANPFVLVLLEDIKADDVGGALASNAKVRRSQIVLPDSDELALVAVNALRRTQIFVYYDGAQ